LETQVVDELIQEVGRSSERWGLSSVLGQVWGTLYFKGEMTQDRLKTELGIGLSSISQNIKVLESLGFISAFRKEGRKRVYKADFSVLQINKLFESLLRLELKPMISLLQSRKDAVQNKNLKDKINNLQKNIEDSANALSWITKLKK
jgi:DNA-binding transcriptional regulator GbsR (MarR family)